MPGQFAIVAATLPPEFAEDEPSVTLGAVGVIVPLVATRMYEPLKTRT